VPRPGAGPGQVLVRSHASLVSAGTERMLVEFGRAGFIDKARQQPDKGKRRLSTVLRWEGIIQRRRDGVCRGRGTFTSSVNVSSS
jgi:hypothetical protein